MDEHENDIKSALTGFGKDQSGLILYANWGSSQTALSNGDWEEDSACKCYVTYYMA